MLATQPGNPGSISGVPIMTQAILHARRLSVAAVTRPLGTWAILIIALSAIAFFVATAIGDPLIGLLGALMAFSVAAPVLGPLLGASGSARS
jgi:predicted membrane protein